MTAIDLSELRKEYAAGEFDINSAAASPFQQFTQWFDQARQTELCEPNAMVLSTVSLTGRPTQRTVLLKFFDEQGFVFFTNYESRKAVHINQNNQISLHFPWFPLQRQVEISGSAEKVSTLESIRYFARRPRDSQLGAWVSQQSSVVSSRSLLLAKWEQMKQKFSEGEIPRPDFWGGFRIKPDRFEFWQGRPSRLHDRIEYLPSNQGGWERRRLSP